MTAPADTQSLTGVWQGFYAYVDGEDAAFTATLIDMGGRLSGTVHEPYPYDDLPIDTLFATVEGARAGQAVSFTKTYDGAAGWTHSVAYEGRLSEDGTEIEGRWTIANDSIGRFLMIRGGGPRAAAERRVEAPVDAGR